MGLPQRWLKPQRREPFSTSSRTPPLIMAAADSSSFSAGGLPPPPGFRPEMGYEGEGEYEHQGGDNPASSGLHGALLPTTLASPPAASVSTPQPFVVGSTVGMALAAYGLSAPLRFALLKAFECGEEDMAEALAETPEAEVEEVLNEVLIDDERAPTRIEKGYVRGFFRKLRDHVSAPPSAPAPTPSTTPIFLQVPDNSSKKEYRDFIDQAAKGHFELLSPKEIAALRMRYEKHTGGPVEGDSRPTDGQLSALASWMKPQPDGRRNPPFVEFAVWGPYNDRSVKLRQFHDHILTRDGSWQFRLLRGPSSFAQWETSWRIFASCCIMLDIAKFGQLQQYYSGIRRLCDLFPNEWATVSLMDEEMRSELWPRLYEEITEGTRPAPRNFDPENPWGCIISESRFDYLQGPLADHWRRKEVQLERAARNKPNAKNLGEAPGSSPAPKPPSHQQAVGVAAPGWGSGTVARAPCQSTPAGWGKKHRRRQGAAQAKFAARPKAQDQNKGKGKGKRKGNELPANFAGCYFCKGPHFLKDCPAWVAAGKPAVQGAPKRQKKT